MPDRSACADHAARVAPVDARDLDVRIRGEFREMPGLTLTLLQAARLFGVEQTQCERALRTLVHDGVLSTDGSTFAIAARRRTPM
jgi:hypothetical protein